MGRKAISIPDREVLQELYNKYGYRYVCHKYKISESLFYKWAKQYNLTYDRYIFKYDIDDEEFIKTYTNPNITVKDMSVMWDIGEHSIRYRAKDLKIKRPKYNTPVIVTLPDLNEVKCNSMSEASRMFNITMDIIRHMVRHPDREVKGYKIRKSEVI